MTSAFLEVKMKPVFTPKRCAECNSDMGTVRWDRPMAKGTVTYGICAPCVEVLKSQAERRKRADARDSARLRALLERR